MMREQRKSGPGLRVIGVVSGKGGVGKTNVTANLAVLAAKAGKRVLVIDGDLGLANIEILYGLRPQVNLGDVLEGGLTIREALAEGPHGVKVLPAGSGLQQLTRLTDEQRFRLVAALDEIEDDFDLILLDAGAGIGDNVMFFVGAAQEALLVVSPEPTSLTDAYATLKVMCQDAKLRSFDVLVNQAGNEAIARDIFDKLSAIVGRFLDARVRYLGYLPRDENVHRAVMAQKPFVELFPTTPASRALNAIADTLLNEPPKTHLDGGLKFLWSRLLRENRAV
jgi:flagellar biosynthesis protein FlhG